MSVIRVCVCVLTALGTMCTRSQVLALLKITSDLKSGAQIGNSRHVWFPVQGISNVIKKKVPGIRQLVEDYLVQVCSLVTPHSTAHSSAIKKNAA